MKYYKCESQKKKKNCIKEISEDNHNYKEKR